MTSAQQAERALFRQSAGSGWQMKRICRIELGIFATQMRFLVVKRDPFENQKLRGPVQASNQIVASVSRSNNDLPEPLWSAAEFAVGVELGQHIRR
jgi:hypothetical protein